MARQRTMTTDTATRLRRRQVVRALARVAAAMLIGIVVQGALPEPAVAQFWNNLFGGPPRQPPRLIPQGQPQPQRGPQIQQPYNPFSSLFGSGPDLKKQQQQPKDYSQAPPPARRSPESIASITSPVLVLGDAMADWLAYGLEDAFSERPEFGIVRRHRTFAGLIRYDSRRDVEWPQIVREAIAAEKPKFIVMMVGFHDRQAIRDRAPGPPPGRGGPQQPAAKSSPPADQDPDSPESRARASADAQNAEMRKAQSAPAATAAQPPGRAAPPPSGPMEFQSEAWQVAYVQKIDATIAALKSANVPVLWVGLPPQRVARQSADAVYLNELYRTRAERAGIVYVDIWDGFVDEAGRYVVQGPDFEGQTRRLRSGDGLFFTLAGARKLAHFIEREILRSLHSTQTPIALPTPEPAVQQPGRPGTARPLAGPVIPLTVTMGGGNELLGGAPTRSSGTDPLATRVLVRGEPVTAPAGRADNFVWPRSGGATIKEPEPEADAAQAQSAPEPAPQVATQTPPQQAPAPVQAAPQQTTPPRPPLRTSIQTPAVPQQKAAPQPKPVQPAVTTTAPRPKTAPPPPQAADGKQPAQRKAPPPPPPRASNDNAPRPPLPIAR